MIALRCVVAATDLSAPARRAADRAARIARRASSSLTLVHAVSGSALDELRRWLDTGGGVEQSLLDDVRGRLRDLASQLSDEYEISVDDLVVVGPKVDEIVRVARERQADLVVTGTLGSGFLRNRLLGSVIGKHGRSAMEHMLLGSTTNRVIGESSSDVLVCTRSDA
jgi:nucleotide-binding universal stress UspA family protein